MQIKLYHHDSSVLLSVSDNRFTRRSNRTQVHSSGNNDKHCNTHSPSLCDIHGIEHLQGLEWHTTVGHVSTCWCRFGHPCHPALSIKHRSQPAIPQVNMLASMNIGLLCYHNDMWIHCSLIDVYPSLVVANYHLLVTKLDDGRRKAHSTSTPLDNSLDGHEFRSVWIIKVSQGGIQFNWLVG